MPIVKCDYCGKEFYKKPSHIAKCKNNFCSMYCKSHFQYQENKIIIKENYAEMIINDYIVLIDIEDIEKINQYKWHLHRHHTGKHYIATSERDNYANRKTIKLHRFIMNCPKDMEVDHINQNKFDNRKCNLRIVQPIINAQNKGLSKANKSGYKNIFYNKNAKKWIFAVIRFHKRYSVYFSTLEEALIEKERYFREVLNEKS